MAEKTLQTGQDDSSLEKWSGTFEKLEKHYKEAYISIDEAIQMDERGKENDALPLYESGLLMIDRALGIPITEPTKPDLAWEKTLAMTQKLKKTRKEILIRIDNLKHKSSKQESELPPSYEDALAEKGLKTEPNGVPNNGNNFQLPGSSKSDNPYISPSMIHDPLLLANLQINESENSNIQNSDVSNDNENVKLAKNEEILFSCNNVMLYFIAPDGRVSSTLEPYTLVIARLHDRTSSILDEALLNIVSDISRENSETYKKKHKHSKHQRKKHEKHKKKHIRQKGGEEDERTFLQVGSWVYPLIPEVSPIIQAEQGTFIFPDVMSDIEGAAVAISMPNEQTQKHVHDLFNTILNDVSSKSRSKRSIPGGYSSKLVRGATYVANNLIKGAGTTARFFDTSAPKVIDKINPHREAKEINPNIQRTVHMAKVFSEAAVDVTEYLGSKIGMATSALGRYLSPHIQKQGSLLLSSATNMREEEASQKISSVLDTVSNAAEGISIVYGGLETAASILAKSLSSNTVQIIEYKYGEEAGALTNDALATVGNMYYTHHNFKVFKPKGFTKAALRGAGSAILDDYRNSRLHSKGHEEFEGSGPGTGAGFLPSA